MENMGEVYGNRVTRKISALNREEVTGENFVMRRFTICAQPQINLLDRRNTESTNTKLIGNLGRKRGL
jgi:hypothetical protein